MLSRLHFIRQTLARKATGSSANRRDTNALAGHSYHGAVLTRVRSKTLISWAAPGASTFPPTCKTEEVQRHVNQGVGQLYGFWLFEAARSFRQASMMGASVTAAALNGRLVWRGRESTSANNATVAAAAGLRLRSRKTARQVGKCL